MTRFLRFPSIPHLAWLGGGDVPRDDKLLSSAEAQLLLAGKVVVEEKLDGANLGVSLDTDNRLRVQNRGQYLVEPYAGQFSRLPGWLAQHNIGIRKVLTPDIILFGEWCAARHSLYYSALPDLYLLFDVYDFSVRRFWSTVRRNFLAKKAGLVTVPQIACDHTSVAALKRIVLNTPSLYRAGQSLEGVVVRRETAEWCDVRAKLVNPNFTQDINTHWRKRITEWNSVDYSFPHT